MSSSSSAAANSLATHYNGLNTIYLCEVEKMAIFEFDSAEKAQNAWTTFRVSDTLRADWIPEMAQDSGLFKGFTPKVIGAIHGSHSTAKALAESLLNGMERTSDKEIQVPVVRLTLDQLKLP